MAGLLQHRLIDISIPRDEIRPLAFAKHPFARSPTELISKGRVAEKPDQLRRKIAHVAGLEDNACLLRP